MMTSQQASGQAKVPPIFPRLSPSAPSNGQGNWPTPSNAFIRPKRSVISVACQNCRRRKSKCNGSRPTCKRCHSRGEPCSYELDRGKALTRVLKQKRDDLLGENKQYRELFQMLCTKPEDEALELLRRIRKAGEPFILLEAARQAEILLPNPSPLETCRNAQLERLDRQALDGSIIKVPARPWTMLAGDGLVSELITNLFTFNGAYFFPVFEKDAFIEDMKSGDVNGSRCCTPFLVNAICAVESNFSERAKQFGDIVRENLSERFFEEAKGLFEREQGRASIPTIIALVLMDIAMAIRGQDRINGMYCHTAYALLSRLSLEQKFQDLASRPGSQKEKRIISRVLWGLYILESRIAFYYSQSSILPTPRVPQPRDEIGTANVDVLGSLHNESDRTIPLVPGINAINCHLTQLWNEVMQYVRGASTQESDADLRIRKSFYCKLLAYMAELPPRFHCGSNMTPTTCMMRMHETEIILTILRDVPLDTPLHNLYHLPGTTARDILRKRCVADIDLVRRYLHRWKPRGGLAYRHTHLCMHALIPLLDDVATHAAFATACMIVQQFSLDLKVMGYLLQGVQAFAWAMGKTMPESARPFLRGCGVEAVEPHVSLSYVLPYQDDVKKALASNPAWMLDKVDNQLGSVIELWARLGQ